MLTHMIQGPAGSGKTTHLDAMKEKAVRQGFKVFSVTTNKLADSVNKVLIEKIKQHGRGKVVLLIDDDTDTRSRKFVDKFIKDPTIRERLAHVFIAQQEPEKNNWYQL